MREQLETLLAQIEYLRRLHRAGETPAFGTLESFFDQAEAIRRGLSSKSAADLLETSTTSLPASVAESSKQRATRLVVEMVGGARVTVAA